MVILIYGCIKFDTTMSENQQPKPRPMDQPELRKLGLFTIVNVLLFVCFIITATHPYFEGIGTVVFMAILGGVTFSTFLMFSREIKQFKKKFN